MLIRSMGSGTLLAAVLITLVGAQGHLDLTTAVLVVVLAMSFGTLDSLLNRQRDPARPGRTRPRQTESRVPLMARSAGNGALVAAMIITFLFLLDRDQVDGGTVVFLVVLGVLSGTLGYVRNRRQGRSDKADPVCDDSARG